MTDQHELEVPPGWVQVAPPSRVPGPLTAILAGAGGVVAVARWAGRVEVHGGVVHEDGRPRAAQAADVVRATAALAALLHPAHRAAVAPLVCVPGDRRPEVAAPGLVVLGEDRLESTLTGLPTHLGGDDVADVVGRIAQARSLRAGEVPTQVTLSATLRADRERART